MHSSGAKAFPEFESIIFTFMYVFLSCGLSRALLALASRVKGRPLYLVVQLKTAGDTAHALEHHSEKLYAAQGANVPLMLPLRHASYQAN